MRSVLRSDKPYWVYLMLTGQKTIEVGKDFPQAEDWDGTLDIYCSKDKKSFNRIPAADREWMRKYLGKVALKFVCNNIAKYKYDIGGVDIDDDERLQTMLTWEEINIYANGQTLYGLYMSDLQVYDAPKELGEFARKCDGNCKIGNKMCAKLKDHRLDVWANCDSLLPLTRPPQSWQYVEVVE